MLDFVAVASRRMATSPKPRSVVRFGVFTAELSARRLYKHGVEIRLQEQPFQVLAVLLEYPGETVSREELRQRLWPTDTFVAFDIGLNAAVNRLRRALGDSAENPQFIETIPRQGYRFIAPVSEAALNEEVGEADEPPKGSGAKLHAPPTWLRNPWLRLAVVITTATGRIVLGWFIFLFAVLILFGAAGFGIYSLLHRPAPTPFQKFTVMQVTNTGRAARAAISPDGRYVLSVMDDNGLQSLWLRNVPTGSDTQVIPPSASQYESLAFSPDGNYIYFRKGQTTAGSYYNLYRSPVLGGTPQTVVRNIDSDIAFSPDGQRIAYARDNDPEVDKYRILTASLEGNDEKVLLIGSFASELPQSLAWPRSDEISYSLYSVERGLGAIDTVDVHTRKSHRFGTFNRKFPFEIRWSPAGHTFFANYWQTGANSSKGQIGFLSGTGGEIEPITRDTNKYTTLTVSTDGRKIATVLARSYATVSILSEGGYRFEKPRILLSQSNEFDEFSALSWSADGNLLVSNLGRLSRLGVDGKNRTQLLADSTVSVLYPSSCGTNYLVLTWVRQSGTNIWRTNADGSIPLKLTDGKLDYSPVCSLDLKWVYYVSFPFGHISRVPLDGSGKAEAIISLPGDYSIRQLSISPDGKSLATFVVPPNEVASKIAVFGLGSLSPPRVLDATHYSGSNLQFSPDGKSLAYASRENGVDNVWVQPLDGSAGHPITNFKSEQIWSFSLSPDGKSLAVLRGHYDSDVVLLQESTP